MSVGVGTSEWLCVSMCLCVGVRGFGGLVNFFSVAKMFTGAHFDLSYGWSRFHSLCDTMHSGVKLTQHQAVYPKYRIQNALFIPNK